MLQIMDISKSVFLFILAGLCEIGGGYLILDSMGLADRQDIA
jgi:drug/metabolite transporter superfamily protein YnfA